mmetsp:Transcript_33017/g.58108  ORF Transcript_33017/g.58108 Transcript_33017/m.58108 type:complete len:142 (-) Transcript_33017:5578-6003(-)
MASPTCLVCAEDLAALSELDKLMHINNCLDMQLEPLLQQLGTPQSAPASRRQSHEPQTQDPYNEEELARKRSRVDWTTPADEVDTTGMPEYDTMAVSQLRGEMEKFGMKKNIDVQTCREILKQVWLYQFRGVFPKFLTQFM